MYSRVMNLRVGNPNCMLRVVCVLCVGLICVMGFLQSTHSHVDAASASHHSCSICAAAHAGLSSQPLVAVPILAAVALVNLDPKSTPIFRTRIAKFIRPPPR